MNAYSQRLKGLIDQFLGDDYPIDARLHGLLSHLDQTYPLAGPLPVPATAPAPGDFWTQEAFFRQVLDTHPSLIYVKDEAGRYLFANQAVAEAVEAAWEAQGLPTFKKYLRDDLERRKAALGSAPPDAPAGGDHGVG